ncbi:MAG: O-antigen ligase family protein [Verrucomicrobiota bacterium]|jgi:hypothetical protein
MLAVLGYFVRATVLPRFLHIPDTILIGVTVLALTLAAGVAVMSGGKWRWSWVIVLVAFAASLSQAEQFSVATLHLVGLALLILAVGPVILNPAAIKLRGAAWRLSVHGLTALTVIFVMWYLLRLPSFGAGFFTSFMGHCMLLGPFAGMGVVIALARAIHGRSWWWGLLALLGLLPVLASGSRIAILAVMGGAGFLLLRRKPIVGLSVVLLCLFVGFRFVSQGDSDTISDSVTGALSYKGTKNTRADLWQSRIEEFRSSPVLGVGVAMGTGSGALVEDSGNIRVEPGSCYLAVLAMTGACGTIAFCCALGFLLVQFVVSGQKTALDKDILSVVGVYLAIHGVAEGWIMNFGGPLCFLFWLWVGNVGDAALQPARANAKRGFIGHPRIVRQIGDVATNSN